MAIFPENQKSYKVLREALECLLTEQRPTLSLLRDDKCPLLVLETSTDTAGFAIVNGTRQRSVRKLERPVAPPLAERVIYSRNA